jgi:hypothetical protein
MCFKSFKNLNVETCVLSLLGGLLSFGELWNICGEFQKFVVNLDFL